MPRRGGSGDLLAGRGQRAAEAPVGRPAGEEGSAAADRRRGGRPPPPRPRSLPRVLAGPPPADSGPQLRSVQRSAGRPAPDGCRTPSLTLLTSRSRRNTPETKEVLDAWWSFPQA